MTFNEYISKVFKDQEISADEKLRFLNLSRKEQLKIYYNEILHDISSTPKEIRKARKKLGLL